MQWIVREEGMSCRDEDDDVGYHHGGMKTEREGP